MNTSGTQPEPPEVAVDTAAVRAALTRPGAPHADPAAVAEALSLFQQAVRRQALADSEAAMSRRPSTLKASLKASADVERARTELSTLLARVHGEDILAPGRHPEAC
jgi:hypothetical protein